MAFAVTPLFTTAITAGATVAAYTIPTSYIRDVSFVNYAPVNSGTAYTIFIGGSTVSTLSGMPLAPNGVMTFEGSPGVAGTIFYVTSVSAATFVVGQNSVVSTV